MPQIAARTLCTTALELIGVASAEQPIHAVTAMRALQTLNTMLDAWSVERLLTWTRPRYTLPLVPSKGAYTWGTVTGEVTAADIPHPAPVRLEICLLNIGGSPAQEWPVEVLTQEQYESGVWFKDLGSSYVEAVYLEDTVPYNVLHCYPVPSMGSTLILLPWQAHSPYESYDAVLFWPSGYQDAFESNLAVRLAPFYSVQVSPELRQWAEESKRALHVINTDIGRLRLDPRRPVGVSGLGYNAAFLRGD
jgi:hypothetical protein